MNTKNIAQELNSISNATKSTILKQVLGKLVAGFFIGISQDVYGEICNFCPNKEMFGEKPKVSLVEALRHQDSIAQITALLKRISDPSSRKIIALLVVSIGYDKLEEFNSILTCINKHTEPLGFYKNILAEDKAIH